MLCTACGEPPGAGMKLKICVCEKVFYCGVPCQKSHWKSHRPNCPQYVIKDIPGKGWGMMAARRLKPGTVILTEEPILVLEHTSGGVPSTSDLEEQHVLALLTTFDKINEENKKKFFSLSDCSMMDKENGPGVVLGNFITNSMGITETKTGVYYMISRINHSCAPNARALQVKQENETLKEVRAFVTIEKGEEISISYINLEQFVLRDDRRKDLVKWNFLCSCKVCSLTGEELLRNEVARKNIQDHHLDMLRYWNNSYTVMGKKKALEFAEKKLDLVLAMNTDMKEQVFASYLDCYALTCLFEKEGGKIKIPPSEYAEKAEKIAQMMGYNFLEKYEQTMIKYT